MTASHCLRKRVARDHLLAAMELFRDMAMQSRLKDTADELRAVGVSDGVG